MIRTLEAKALVSFIVVGSCVLLGLLLSCNQPFDPRGALDEKPVVFAVLSTDRNMQFIHVERSYMPSGYDPLADTSDKSIRNAIVTISDGSLTMSLRDTTLPQSGTSRFKVPMRAYVVNPYRPVYGGSYNIKVQTSEFGTALQKVVVPAKSYLGIDATSIAIIDQPDGYKKDASILFPIILGNGAYGYRGRMLVDYEVLKDGEWVEERVEIPMQFATSGANDYRYLIYPQIIRTTSNNHAVGVHMNGVYLATLFDVAYTKYPATKIVFNRIVFQLLQVDQNLYSYYLTTHSYNDPHSTRLDEPFFSGVVGGVGLIGAYTLDSLVHILPENFSFDRY